ncbi:MAG: hypothetical protein NTX45_27570 [Proteobacteria bacterium]|nr:hypothetical protein [Pseudomonadota bacterium]
MQRLLGRFLSQGFVHHDLSRACLAQSEDAIPRVVMLGRLALYGPGAVRLHEELLTVTARWQEPARRKQGLLPYGRDTEARTLELLERALLPQASGHAIAEPVQRQLQASLPMDIGQLLPHLEARGQQARTEAEQRLADRGRIEAESLRNILEDQRKRVAEALGKPIQMTIDFDDALPEEIRQAESNRRYWERWLQGVDADLKREPERIMDFYRVVSTRIEPVGIAYLWPITG